MSGRYAPPTRAVHQRRMQLLSDTPTPLDSGTVVVQHWQSRDHLALVYREDGHTRLTVNRVQQDTRTGNWREGISWEDLMRIKSECGLGAVWAVEVYPPDDEVVNVAAMRHLWLLEEAPAYAWRRQ